MTKEEIARKVNEAFIEEFEMEPQKLTPEARIREDLGLDSLDVVDMVIVVEKAFDMKLPDRSALAGIATMGDIYDLLCKLQDAHK